MLLHTTIVHTCGRPAELVATSKEGGGILFVNVCGPLREDLGAMALGHSRVTAWCVPAITRHTVFLNQLYFMRVKLDCQIATSRSSVILPGRSPGPCGLF